MKKAKQITLLLNEAMEYPLVVRLAYKLHLMGITSAQLIIERKQLGHMSDVIHGNVVSQLRNFESGTPASMGYRESRLKEMADEIQLPQLPQHCKKA